MRSYINNIHKTIHYPLLLILMGSVFLCSFCRIETIDFIRTYWTVGGLYILTLVDGIRFIHNRQNNNSYISTGSILWAIYITGILEAIYVLLQLMRIFPSTPTIYNFTGSFANPAIASMLFSFAIPIGLYFTTETKKQEIQYAHLIASLFMFFLIFLCICRTGILATFISSIIVISIYNNRGHHIVSQTHNYIYVIIAFITLFIIYLLYIVKPDSANGRALIWRVAINMLKDRPWFGYGLDGFDASYMVYQAKYFINNPNSVFSLLADNACSLYNEFIHVAIVGGLIGVCTFSILLYIIAYFITKNPKQHKGILYALYSIILIWCLTYFPFSIQFVWVLSTSLLISLVISSEISYKLKRILYIVFISIFSICLLFNAKTIYYKAQWHIVQEEALKGRTLEMLPAYSKLYAHLKQDADYLYNYGAELHYIERYSESLYVLKECSNIYNDYNIQMLIADDFAKLGYIDSAIDRFTYANQMIPNRFLPLYHIMKLYITRNDHIKTKTTAINIINKPIKIKESKSVQRIREEAYFWLND